MKSPQEIVGIMLNDDLFSQWLGIEVLEIKAGFCRLNCVIKNQMLNGFSIAHGGISYSLSDSALAFASNSYGNQCVSIETSISHLKKVLEKDILTITCSEINRGKSVGVYEVKITNQKQELISIFKGTVHISSKIW